MLKNINKGLSIKYISYFCLSTIKKNRMHFIEIHKATYRKAFLLLLISLFIVSCGTSKKLTTGETNTGSIQNEVIAYGKKYLHTPYRSGGKTPKGFDCSGFTSFVYKNFGYKLNYGSSGQAVQVPSVNDTKDLKKGDLVFFEGRKQDGTIGHVGIVSEVRSNGRFLFIHSSSSNGVIISSSEEPYYKTRYVKGGRIIEGDKYYAANKSNDAANKSNDAVKQSKTKKKKTSSAKKTKKTTQDTNTTKSITVVNPDNSTQLVELPSENVNVKKSDSAPVKKTANQLEAEQKEKKQEQLKKAIELAMSLQEPIDVPEPEINVLSETES